VFLTYASPAGHALIDRRLYLPESWCQDADRRTTAHVPAHTVFATKPALALDMLAPAGIAELGLGYVLAVPRSHRITTVTGVRRRADHVAGGLPPTAWQRYSAGTGSKGPRWYDWAWIDTTEDGPGHSLLIRRTQDTGELAFYYAYTPTPVSLPTLVQVAGIRWCIEEAFQAAKSQVGLDHYQIRGWTGWHRFATLAMLALAYLAITRATLAPAAKPSTHDLARTTGPIPLTINEIRRLHSILLNPPQPRAEHALHWSLWRRSHQGRARNSHYKRHMGIATNS
jgi:SRSO17 transposase